MAKTRKQPRAAERPPAPQQARLGDAMAVAHTMTMADDLQAMDPLIELTGELDRYHGFGHAEIAVAPQLRPPPRIAAPPREPAAPKPAPEEAEREIFRAPGP
jgi:hypothetical protein